MLDLIGIGLVAPYIALLVDPEIISQGRFLQLFNFIGVSPYSEKLILYLSFFIIILFALKFISALVINWIILRFCFQQSVRLRSKLMAAYQNLPYIRYVNRNSSEYIYNINSIVPQFTMSILQSFLRLISEGLVAVSIFALLLWYDPKILLVFGSVLLVIIYIYDLFSRNRISDYGRIVNDSSTKMVQGINEGINGLKEIRILGKEKYFYNRVVANAKKYANASMKTTLITTMPRYFLEFIVILFVTLLAILTIILDNNSENMLITLSIFGMASIRLMPSANSIISGLTQIRFGRNTINRLFTDIQKNTSPLYSKIDSSVDKANSFKSLKFDNVSFAYPGIKKNILNKISLEIYANDSIGLIGASGSGKTTLVDLILGLLEPHEGFISYNNQAINGNLERLRAQTAYLPQQAFLTDDTLRNNVALGVDIKNIDDHKVIDSLKRACLFELLETMPNGLDSILGEDGVMISGGQRQRISLARAFYHERKILVMDESTSALDDKTESEIVSEIKQLKGKVTLIVIAHSLSTIQHCENVYKIEMGKIIKQVRNNE